MKKILLSVVCFLAYCLSTQAQVLFGTTYGGSEEGGSIFKFIPATKILAVVKTFEKPGSGQGYINNMGSRPAGGLVQASDGKLYGVTSNGGSKGYGVIFSFNPASSSFAKVKDFDNTNGGHPVAGLVQAGNGKLYGMTPTGGKNNRGVIFSFEPSSGSYIKLKDLDGINGSNPNGTLVQAGNGKLYGLTANGGNKDVGVIFSFDPASSAYTKLKDFDITSGANPSGSLLRANDGKLYGVTRFGGTNDEGVIFSFNPSSPAFKMLQDCNGDGANPFGSLIQASNGKLYGVAYPPDYDEGTFFSFNLSTAVSTNYFFGGDQSSAGSLMQASNGNLYGVGPNGLGGDGVFSIDLSSSAVTFYTELEALSGTSPNAPLIEVTGCIAGNIYYEDADGDGYGNAAKPVVGCPVPTGYVTNNLDCIDDPVNNGSAIHPGAIEVCNGIDDDCDGKVDSWTLEAEDAVLNGALVASGQTGYTGYGYADYASGTAKYIEWTVNASAATSFSLKFRYANGGTTNRPLQLKINGVVVAASLAFSPTGGWATWSILSSNVNLTAGLNKVRLTTLTSHGPNVDNLAVAFTACQAGILEAEQALLHGALVASGSAGYTGNGYADYLNASGDYVEWTVKDLAAGSYSLKFRYSNGATTNRPLQLKVNGAVIAANLAFSPTGGWTTWSLSSATASLIAGTNKVRLTTIGSNGPNLDHLKPEIIAECQSGILEAENAVLNGAAVATNQTGYTGTGFADFQSATGLYIEWTVNAVAAGPFSLKFRYANGSMENRPLKLTVNGAVVVASLAFSPTASWSTWSLSSATASLNTGVNKVRLTTIGTHEPNVDNLSFTCSTNTQPVQRIPATQTLSFLPPGIFKAAIVPNPVQGDKARLVVSTASNLPIELTLVDMAGRTFNSIKVTLKGSNTIDFPVNQLSPGAYTVILKQGNLNTHTRLIIGRK